MLARFLEPHAFVENIKASNKRGMISLTMNALVKIDSQLRDWIKHNLDRGCPPEQLIEGMIEQRFDPPIAQGLVRAFVAPRRGGVPLTADTVSIDMPAAAYVQDPPRLTAGNSICS